MDWKVLYLATCLALLFEGVPLFIAPKQMRRSALAMAQMNETTLRIVGLVIMLLGLGLMVAFSE